MKTDAKLLWQAVKNATLYSVAKGFAGGVEFSSSYAREELTITTCDNFVAIYTNVNLDSGDTHRFFLSHKAVNDLEKALRGLEGDVELYLNGNKLDVVSQGIEISSLEAILTCPDEAYWEMLSTVVDNCGILAWHTNEPFEVGGARLAKLSLLEPKSRYPVSHCAFSVQGNRVVGFKYGPKTTVVVMPLDRDMLDETYDDLGDVVW